MEKINSLFNHHLMSFSYPVGFYQRLRTSHADVKDCHLFEDYSCSNGKDLEVHIWNGKVFFAHRDFEDQKMCNCLYEEMEDKGKVDKIVVKRDFYKKPSFIFNFRRAVKREFHPPGEAERGALLEGWVGVLLKAYGESGSGLGLRHDELFYWAPAAGGTEVDFLIQRGKEFTAIEVKAKESLSSRDFKGLKAIAELKGIHRRLVVFLGERPFRTEDGIEAMPIRSFLEELEEKTI